jgi:hypothetical protein
MIEAVDIKECAGFTGGCGNCQQWLRRLVEVGKRAHQRMSSVKLSEIRERSITNVRFAVNCRTQKQSTGQRWSARIDEGLE